MDIVHIAVESICECGKKVRHVAGTVPVCRHRVDKRVSLPPNPWAMIHTRYAEAVKSGRWDELTEDNWLKNEFSKLVPCGSCGSKWLSLAATIDLSSPESAFHTLWEAHNTVSTRHVDPPLSAMSYEQCRKLWLGPKIAVLHGIFANHGGTEAWAELVLPRLRHFRNIIGFGAITGGGNPASLKVPYYEGRVAIKKICRDADVVLTWPTRQLMDLIPSERRPKVIGVHHSDLASGWFTDVTMTEFDAFVGVNREVCIDVQSKNPNLPVHWIPNAVDPQRIQPTKEIDSIRASIPAGSKVLLFGHRMAQEKRPQLAIAIAERLPSDWILVMAGDGPMKPTNTPANVRLVGHLPTLADWLTVADCFLSLSTFEGFGLSMAEAHAAGVPIVATPVGIGSEVAVSVLPVEASAHEWADAIVNSVGKSRPWNGLTLDDHVARWASIL